jgi:general secretion pathway protein A
MYQTRFGLQRRPFPATPDSSCYYPATSHERALACLLQAVENNEGLTLLTGEPGTGKTLLCHCLLERLGADTTCAFLTNSHISGCSDLLQALLYDLSLPHEGGGEQELRLRLTDYLLQNFCAGQRTVLVVDEAQHLGPGPLEELRLLGNLEAGQGKAVQVILAAQTRILQTLRRPELAGLNQRLAVRARVAPLGVEEAADYLLHHVRVAGGRPDAVLSEEALEVLARGTQGVPRLLNQAAHQALLLADEAGAEQVDAEAALEALTRLGLEAGELSADEVQCFPGAARTGESAEDESRSEEREGILPVSSGEGAGLSASDGGALELPAYRLYEAPRRQA